MQDITDVQRRLSGALDRIDSGLDGLGPVDPSGYRAETLAAELETERDLTRQLQERLNRAEAEKGARAAAAEADLARARSSMAALEEDRERLQALSETLRATCETLRQAAAEGISDAGLVNDAMGQELEALATMRRSDRAELEAVIGLLDDSMPETGGREDG